MDVSMGTYSVVFRRVNALSLFANAEFIAEYSNRLQGNQLPAYRMMNHVKSDAHPGLIDYDEPGNPQGSCDMFLGRRACLGCEWRKACPPESA